MIQLQLRRPIMINQIYHLFRCLTNFKSNDKEIFELQSMLGGDKKSYYFRTKNGKIEVRKKVAFLLNSITY